MVSNSLRVCGVCESGGICDLQGYSRKLDVVFTMTTMSSLCSSILIGWRLECSHEQ